MSTAQSRFRSLSVSACDDDETHSTRLGWTWYLTRPPDLFCALHTAMNVLFVCTANRLRSPTAEALFADHPGIETRSAGFDADCPSPLSAELILWADLIFVMEARQREKIRKKFRNRPGDGAIINLNIPDDYERDQPELIALLESRVRHRIDQALEARGRSV